MRRRDFLALAGSSALVAGCDFSFEQGFFNGCGGPGLTSAGKALFDAAIQPLRRDHVWDMHAHLFGNHHGPGGLYLNTKLDRPRSPGMLVRRKFFLNAGCIQDDDGSINDAMVARLLALVKALDGPKLMLVAFDYTHAADGKRNEGDTTFHVPDDYAMSVAKRHEKQFEWIASIHPYDPNCVERLRKAHAGGARAVKWLPPSMHIDPSSEKCDRFYDEMARLDVPLLSHTGDEHAVVGAVKQELGDPLLLERPLKKRVRVIAAHCATLGEGAFERFVKLMNAPEHKGFLFGDISAVTQINRAKYLPTLLERDDWHPRLLNGSDYPLPGVLPIFSLKGLVELGVLDASLVPALRELRETNPLAFDLTLKRNLRFKGKRFPASVFETRSFFERR